MKSNILITGVSSGIGKSLCLDLLDNFNVYGISRRDPCIDGILHYSLDLTDFTKFDECVNSYKNMHFDAVIFNAGAGYFDDFTNISDNEIINMINLNAISPILLLKKLLPLLNKKTKIIFIGSVAGKKFFKYGAAYQASKFALRGFAGSVRNELSQSIFILNPQFVDTDFFKNDNTVSSSIKSRNETKIDTILGTVSNILSGSEKRFEIDL